MARILVTGGAVHTKLDAVKIVTNRFKGGRMAILAHGLSTRKHKVTYMCAKGMKQPIRESVEVVHHDGFLDYMHMVPETAKDCDMVVLGAAVANLVPEPPWDVNQKFPSHDYQEGDTINIPFRVAPRIINEVKKANPRCTLIGFKLLSGISDEELVRAAYTIITEAKADLVVANDVTNLDRKLLVTKERSVIEAYEQEIKSDRPRLLDFLHDMANDQYYTTVWQDSGGRAVSEAMEKYTRVVAEHKEEIEKHGRVGDMVFGCVAVRVKGDGFLCSPRGKNGVDAPPVHVRKIHDSVRQVVVGRFDDDYSKASLNAPLLNYIFEYSPRTWGIVHTHQTDTGLSVSPYSPPGTVRDTERHIVTALPEEDFEIEHHGTFTHLLETL